MKFKTLLFSSLILIFSLSGLAADHDPVKMTAGHSQYLVEQTLGSALDAFEVHLMGALGMAPSIDPLNRRVFEVTVAHAVETLQSISREQTGSEPPVLATRKLIQAANEYLQFIAAPGVSGVFNVHQFRLLLHRGLKQILEGRRLLKLQSMGSPGPLQDLSRAEANETIARGQRLFLSAEELLSTVEKEKHDEYNIELLERARALRSLLTDQL